MSQKAFISYAIEDSEEYVLTLISNLLNYEGYLVESSYDEYDPIGYSTRRKIMSSSLFIGMITSDSSRNQNVINEWQLANSEGIPSLLLVDDVLRHHLNLPKSGTIYYFDRYSPDETIKSIRQKIRIDKQAKKNQSNENAAAWVVGGLAVLALISLLSRRD